MQPTCRYVAKFWNPRSRRRARAGAAGARPSRHWRHWIRASPKRPGDLASPSRPGSHVHLATLLRQAHPPDPPRLPRHAGHPGHWCLLVRCLLSGLVDQ